MLIQTGRLGVDTNNPGWRLDEGNGVRTFQGHINFPQGFAVAPKVEVALAHLGAHITGATGINLSVVAKNATADGFDVEISTWGDSRIAGASAMWIAHGPELA